MEAEPSVEIVGFDRTEAGFERLDGLVELTRTTMLGEGVDRGRLDLVVVDPDEMARLNLDHMGHEGPTDVLSFPLDAEEALQRSGDHCPDLGPAASEPPLHLGDIVVCPQVARDQAPGHCGTEEAELALLVIHGVLHVLGHDHGEPGETARMQSRERHHLAALGFEHPGPAVPT